MLFAEGSDILIDLSELCLFLYELMLMEDLLICFNEESN